MSLNARPHFSFLSHVSSRFCSSQLQVLPRLPSLVSKSNLLFLLGFTYFFFLLPFYVGVFHSIQPNPLVAKQWLMALRAVQRERVHFSPGAVDLPNHLPVTPPPIPAELTHHPTPFRGNLRVLGQGGASSKSPLRQTKRSGVVFTEQHSQQSQAL